MITLSDITELLGWASIINISTLMFATLILTVMKSTILAIHSKIFGISENELQLIYVNYMANYKTLIFVFILSPYLALKIMGQ